MSPVGWVVTAILLGITILAMRDTVRMMQEIVEGTPRLRRMLQAGSLATDWLAHEIATRAQEVTIRLHRAP